MQLFRPVMSLEMPLTASSWAGIPFMVASSPTEPVEKVSTKPQLSVWANKQLTSAESVENVSTRFFCPPVPVKKLSSPTEPVEKVSTKPQLSVWANKQLTSAESVENVSTRS